jgi:shikimate dehydrogenase
VSDTEVVALSWKDGKTLTALTECDLLVNCTSVGMKDSAGEGKSPLGVGLIPKRALVYDVVYNPIETPLISAAKKAGARTLGGLPMLVYQGAASFELWTGKSAPIDIMMRVAKRAL